MTNKTANLSGRQFAQVAIIDVFSRMLHRPTFVTLSRPHTHVRYMRLYFELLEFEKLSNIDSICHHAR